MCRSICASGAVPIAVSLKIVPIERRIEPVETTNYTILDGGMGTMLQAAGLPVGQLPEVWNLTNPEQVARIQR